MIPAENFSLIECSCLPKGDGFLDKIFECIGPVIVGPSSSHTAGAAKIGIIARRLLGEDVKKATITLYDSFAKTAKGHGTDNAIVGGLLGFNVDDERLKTSLDIAREKDIDILFKYGVNAKHPNTVFIELTGVNGGQISVRGVSTGGGVVEICEIDKTEVSMKCELFTIYIKHEDKKGTVASVTKMLADSDINIANMNVYRDRKGGYAAMVIETDQCVHAEIKKKALKLDHIISASFINSI
jgi:L-serine dehydratase